MLRVTDICKTYGRLRALDGLSFDAPAGKVLGLLGPNGAGKSTAMRIITGYMIADQGTVELSGTLGPAVEVHRDPLACRARTGWMPESIPVYEDMEADAYLRFVAAARGIGHAEADQRIARVADEIGLAPMIRRPIRELSRGYRQRVGLAQALLHDPDVLVLDEPTSGLDPTQLVGLHAYLRDLAHDRGKAVVFSSHILSEVEAVADTLVVLARGRKVYDGPVGGLVAAVKGAADFQQAFLGVVQAPAGAQETAA